MKKNATGLIGIILIVFGVAMLLREYFHFEIGFETLRSYGFLLLGLLGLVYNFAQPQRKSPFLFTFLMLIGLYYTLAELGVYEITRGLSLSAWTLACGLAHYPTWLLQHPRRATTLIWGNLFVIIGLLFLGYELRMISTHIFLTIIDDYWPTLLILLGIGFLIDGYFSRKESA
jgi:drug/metabolite transporter (DMT)-like permease